ncbi:hypothetical protein QPK87_28940 [Kamptonema cortianum]|nr:hypothetical protein [Kamptonema cortianum]
MRTPSGRDCRFYYEDFNRGRNLQECRLIKQNPQSLRWKSRYCETCRVPDILNANASPNLELSLAVVPVMLGLGRRLKVEASCMRHRVKIEDPFLGCPQCNEERPGLDLFWQALSETDESSDHDRSNDNYG